MITRQYECTTQTNSNGSIKHNQLIYRFQFRFLRASLMLCRDRNGRQIIGTRYFVAGTLVGSERFCHERLSRDTRRYGTRFRRHPDGHHKWYFEFQRYYCAIHRDRNDQQRDRGHRVVGRVPDRLRCLCVHEHHLLLVWHLANPDLGSFAGQRGGASAQRLRLR